MLDALFQPNPFAQGAGAGGFSWLVRRADLTDEQNRLLDRLGLPERAGEDGAASPSHYMPPGAIALVFVEKRNPADPLVPLVFTAIITDSNAGPGAPPRVERGEHP